MAPVTAKVLAPHVATVDGKVRPGLLTLTWTSLSVDAFLADVSEGLGALRATVERVNDILAHRVDANLKAMTKMVLVRFPPDGGRISLDDFILLQESAVADATATLVAKNVEVSSHPTFSNDAPPKPLTQILCF